MGGAGRGVERSPKSQRSRVLAFHTLMYNNETLTEQRDLKPRSSRPPYRTGFHLYAYSWTRLSHENIPQDVVEIPSKSEQLRAEQR